jgi:hypothetical protein
MKRLLHILVILAMVVMTLGAALPAQAATPGEINDAISDGLAWLASVQNANGSFGSGYLLANTATAVLAMENEGHFPGGGTLYSVNVEKGLDYIFTFAAKVSINNQTAGNPDTNGNGQGVRFSSSSQTYETGMIMQTLADSHTPSRVVTTGACNGMTYFDVLTDVVDWCSWGQVDTGSGRGGWTYSPVNNASSNGDGSVSPWVVLGLVAADQWGIHAPAFVKSELDYWITYIQAADGGAGYNDPTGIENIGKTGGLLVEMYYYGDNSSTPRAQLALGYINTHWQESANGTWNGNYLHPYAMFGLFKGLSLMNVSVVPNALPSPETPAGDWWGDYCEHLVNNQNASGSWSGYSNWTGAMATGWYIVILQATVFPVEVDIEVQPPACTNGYDVATTYSVQRFQASGTVEIYEDGVLKDTITLTDFQGSATDTYSVASDSEGPHTWRALLEVETEGGIQATAEDTDIESVVICEPPEIEVGGTIYLINKLIVLIPVIVLAAVLAIGTTVLVRRHQKQS